MERAISVVIPNHNMAASIGLCLEAAFQSDYTNYEVIVVDDLSDDNSLDILKKYPCTLIQLQSRSGASRARNTGAYASRGEVIFFIDADCLLQKDTLSIVNDTVSAQGPDVIIGGTYTRVPYDSSFYSMFQSVFVNYSETKKSEAPDYIAAHAMIIDAALFRQSGGFPEDFLPIIEDVEFTHRLKRSGYRLAMNPRIEVQHIFNFNFMRSMKNALRKTTYWNIYSLRNGDVFTDSGSASYELKSNVAFFLASMVSCGAAMVYKNTGLLLVPLVLFVLNLFISRRLLRAFHETAGPLFACKALLYYMVSYPVPVGMGTVAGIVKYFFRKTD